ncbi:MAG: hypothetical protein JW860_10510 [Sedimentisphaerales bacterium]|nr:hypothetical protein [Sedimentisphaerales bacterium]
MKNSSEYAVKLKKLCSRLKRDGSASVKMEPVDPLTGIILACLSEVTTENKSRSTLSKLRHEFVDYNELRVARVEEITELLGKSFPQAKDVSRRIVQVLINIFNKCDSLELDFLCDGNKRQAKSFLEGIEDMSSYMLARVMLQSIGAHAFPVNQQMMNMLLKEEVVDPEATVAEVQGFLERQISASQIHKLYPLLRKHADGPKTKWLGSQQDDSKKSSPKAKKKTTKRKTKPKTR